MLASLAYQSCHDTGGKNYAKQEQLHEAQKLDQEAECVREVIERRPWEALEESGHRSQFMRP